MELQRKKESRTRSSFWGIRCDSGKKYSQVVEHKFHISMAALDPGAPPFENRPELGSSSVVSLILECSGAQFVLCSLRPNQIPQVPLDLNFETGEEIAFSIRGSGAVHLSGYYIYDENDVKPDAKSNVRIENSGQKISKRKNENANPVKNIKMKEIVIDDSDDDGCEEFDKTLRTQASKKETSPLKKKRAKSSDSEEEEEEEEEDDNDDDDDDEEEEEEDSESESSESTEELKRSLKFTPTPKVKPKKRPVDEPEEEYSDDSIVDYLSGSSDEEDVPSPAKKSAPVQNKKQKTNAASTPLLANKAGVASPKKVSFPNLDNDAGKSATKTGKNQMEKFPPGSLDSSIGRTPMPKKTVNRFLQAKTNDSFKSKFNPDSGSDSVAETVQLNKSISESDKDKSSALHNASGDVTSSKKKKKKKKKSLVSSAGNNESAPESVPNKSFNSASTPKYSKKLAGGVEYDDIRVGNGPVVQRGKLLHVYYTGKLDNNKIFEARTQGSKPFSFRQGANQVIKGWEIGMDGMKVGGKRRMKIPPHLAYGKPGSGSIIPPNSTLHFVVDLKAVS